MSSVNVVDGFHNNGRLVSHHSNLVKMRINHIPRQTKRPKKTNKQKTKDRNEKKKTKTKKLIWYCNARVKYYDVVISSCCPNLQLILILLKIFLIFFISHCWPMHIMWAFVQLSSAFPLSFKLSNNCWSNIEPLHRWCRSDIDCSVLNFSH